METKNIMSIMVVALVGAVILAGFLPVIGATQSEAEKTVNLNTGYNHTMDLLTDDVIIEIDYTQNADAINVNVGGTIYPVDLSQSSTVSTWLFYSDVCMLWVDRVASPNTPVYAIKSTSYTANVASGVSVFTYDNDTKEVSLTINGTETFNDTVEQFAYVYTADKGKYGYFTGNVTVAENSTIEAFRGGGWWDYTYVTYSATGKDWFDSVNTPIAGMAISKDSQPTEYDAVYSSSHWVDNGNKTYTVTSNATQASFNDGEVDITNNVAMRYIAPIEYISYEDNATSDVIGLLPLVMAVGLLMFVVGAILIRRV